MSAEGEDRPPSRCACGNLNNWRRSGDLVGVFRLRVLTTWVCLKCGQVHR